jgi:tetratricopeptide (TPR) repeat protein
MMQVSNTRRLAGVFLVCLLLAACATPPQTRQLLATRPAGLPATAELTTTPFFPQQHYQCGPAALATVLGARGHAVTPEQLVDAVYVPALQGSLPEEITATARRYGMLAYPLQASLDHLLREIAHGNPVLVFQNLGTGWLPKWHFAVVIGYDLQGHEIILRSGTTRRWRTTLGTFERTWSRAGHWALIILPAGDIPATAEPGRYLQAARDLEATGQPEAAGSAWQAATQRWPELPTAWLAFGNSRYQAQDFYTAETAFRKASALAPGKPQGWNNLAYALLKNGCPQLALQAAACAAGLAPQAQNYRDTVKEITGLARGSNRPDCVPIDCGPASARQ